MSKSLATKQVATVILATAMVFGLAFSFAAPAKADVISDLQAQIQALLAQIAALQAGGSTVSSSACTTFTQNLKQGMSGGEVMAVQKFLNSMPDTMVASTGAGSPGNETSYFGPATKAAVIKFQDKYAADVLAPVGLSAGTGYWGASSRAKANSLCTTTGTGTGTGTGTTPTGSGLIVGTATQPANSLAPKNASRVPFTTFTLTNVSGAVVTITGVTVERTGLAADANFSGVILVDEMGTQIGNSKTFNSNHQATVGDTFTINPGQTKTLTIAGNISATPNAGEVASISVIGINTTATISGSLPISGALHTMNSTLTVGSLIASIGSTDLNANQPDESIGKTNEIGASVRLAAQSAEDVWVKSIRWNQSGSAGAGDIGNVVTIVDGTTYPTTVSADGKYYTTVFPGNGIQIMKGLNKEFNVQFDILSGPSRTVQFDLYKSTDIYAVGGTFGYGVGVTPNTTTTAGAGSQFTTGTPFFDGSQFTISAGTVTSLSRANEVPAQNIAIASPNQPLGGFALDVKGESISVQSQVYYFNYSSGTASGNLLTSVSLVDENGAIIAGPVDATNVGGGEQKATFTDTVTFPTGRHVYTLKGQVPSTVSNGVTVTASTTPSTDWSSATGQVTGNSISLSGLSTAVSGNTMTVRTGSVILSIASIPAAQTVVSGVSGQSVSGVNFDATQSGEDVRFNSAKFRYTDGLTGGDITNCFAYNGDTKLNDSAVNPTETGTDYTFTFNSPLVVAKGTVVTVTIKCDISSAITAGTFSVGFTSAVTFTGTGVMSTQSITPTSSTAATQAGNTQTIAGAGALTVALDASSPSFAIATAGSSNVTLAALRFNGTNEDMRLDRVALQLPTGTASSSPDYITQVTLWDGATQVGTAIFAGTRFATSTLSGTVIIPANGSKTLTVKGNLGNIGIGQATTTSYLAQVDYDNDDSTGTRAIGQSSGTTINRTSSGDTASAGVRVYRSIPTVAKLSVPSTTLVDGTLDLYRFSVKADAAREISLYQIVANIATSAGSVANGTTTLGNVKVYAYTDAGFTNPVAGFVGGQVVATIAEGSLVNGDNELQMSSILTIPAGATYYFKIVGDVSHTTGTSNWSGSITTYLAGDTSYVALAETTQMAQASAVDSDANDDFIWSPNSTSSTPSFTNLDWTNGLSVPGLPGTGTDSVTISR